MTGLDPRRTVAELRELAALTSDARGAQRVAFTPPWERARAYLRGLLDELGAQVREDAAHNLWARPADAPGAGDGGPLVAVGSHLDSVPGGGWLDGALGVLAGLEVLRASRSPRLVLVDWADEEGRFGHSLLGSSASAGLLDAPPAGADGLVDPAAAAERPPLAAYLELHIEQGPVLERAGAPLAPVSGTAGVRRERLRFTGRAAHAGATPLDARHDPVAAAARFVLAARETARTLRGLATVGALAAEPGTPTAVAAAVALTLDARHPDPDGVRELHAALLDAASGAAEAERCELTTEPLWSIDPVAFDAWLVARAEEAVTALGHPHPPLASGPLHDAAAMAQAGVPSAMLFVRSRGGVSHTPEEDSAEADLHLAVRALAALTEAALEREDAAPPPRAHGSG